MNIYTKNFVHITAVLALMAGSTFTSSVHAGWKLGQDIIDIGRGKKELKIEPRISATHGKYGVKIDTRKNTGSFDFGPIRGKTTQLDKRSAQAACMYATGGNARRCMPDIIARETRSVQQRMHNTPQYRLYQNYNNQYQSAQQQYQQHRQVYDYYDDY